MLNFITPPSGGGTGVGGGGEIASHFTAVNDAMSNVPSTLSLTKVPFSSLTNVKGTVSIIVDGTFGNAIRLNRIGAWAITASVQFSGDSKDVRFTMNAPGSWGSDPLARVGFVTPTIGGYLTINTVIYAYQLNCDLRFEIAHTSGAVANFPGGTIRVGGFYLGA